MAKAYFENQRVPAFTFTAQLSGEVHSERKVYLEGYMFEWSNYMLHIMRSCYIDELCSEIDDIHERASAEEALQDANIEIVSVEFATSTDVPTPGV